MTEPVPPIDRLLAERPWVTRLARALAADDASADDLAQDAWLAALRTPPADAGAVRGWFRRVMRNRVHENHRRSERRERREAASARTEAQPSTEAIVARAEAHRAVVEAVFALDEPFRTTVVLRYFEGLETREIAERLGVPPDTVRARLRRAQATLRVRLEPDEDRPPAWALLLVPPPPPSPFAPPPVPGGASFPAPASLVPGGLAVSSTSVKLIAGAALLLLAGLAVWTLAPDDGGGASGDGAARIGTPAGDAETADRTAATRARASDLAPGGGAAAVPADGTSLVGDVRFVVGDRPAEGATIVLRGPRGATQAVADGSGGFRFAGLVAGEPLRIVAAAPGCATATQSGIRLVPGEARRAETLWLDAPVAVDVRVVAPDRAPVAGARVAAFRARSSVTADDWQASAPEPETSVETGPDGRAAFPALAVGSWTFRATHDDFAPAAAAAPQVRRGGVPLRVEIRMEPGFALTGTVTDAAGGPVADTVVAALPPVEATALMTPAPLDPRGVLTRTDAEGRYRFAALAAGDHALAVLLPGSLPARVGVVSIPSVSRFDARLDGGVIAGVVTDADGGGPVEGAEVRAAVWRRHSPTFLTATSDAAGRYRLAVPLGGVLHGPARGDGEARAQPVNFDVRKEGWTYVPEAGATPWRSVFLFGGETAEFDVVMRRAATLSGTVRGPDGPVAGASVVADVWNELRGSLPHRATTDAAGRYRIPGLPDGRARIVVVRDGYLQRASPGDGWRGGAAPAPDAVAEIPRIGDVTFDVELVRGASLRGRVVSSAGGPVAAARVRAVAAGVPERATTTDADGSFEILGLRAGHETALHGSCEGFEDAVVRVLPTEDAAPAPVELRLPALGRLRGRVAGGAGGPPPGAWVQVAPAKLALETGYEVVGVWHGAPRHAVGADGAFDVAPAWVAGASDDGFVVRAGAPGFAPAISARLPVPRDGDADAGTLVLERGLRLEGRVVAADGSGPVDGAEIEFQNEELPPALGQRRDWSAVGRSQTPFEWVARTGPDGRFVVEGLPPWRYELRVNAMGYGGATPVVAVPQSEPVTIELPRLRPLSGTVTFDDGAPAAGLVVLAHAAGGGVAGTAESGPDGRFEIDFLAEGRYELEARRPWDRAMDVIGARSGAVEAGTADATIVVRRGAGRISGVCRTEDGRAVPGAVVHAQPVSGGPMVHARSAPDGSFVVASLGDGPWTVTAEANRSVGGPDAFGRRLVAHADDVATGATAVDLVFRAPLPISGRVFREDGAAPAGRLVVRARPLPDGRRQTSANVGRDGSFTLTDTTAGRWALTVIDASTGRELRADGAADVVAGATAVRVTLATSSGFAGRVVDDRGRPVAGVLVVARSATGSRLDAFSGTGGGFQIAGADAGTWTVEAAHPDEGRAELTGVAPGAADLVLSLRPGDPVAARVLDASGEPVRGAVVTLADAAGREVARLRTDADGRFSTRALPAGTYDVRVARDGAGEPVAVGSVTSAATGTVLRLP